MLDEIGFDSLPLPKFRDCDVITRLPYSSHQIQYVISIKHDDVDCHFVQEKICKNLYLHPILGQVSIDQLTNLFTKALTWVCYDVI